MASKASPAARPLRSEAAERHREKRSAERGRQAVARFQTSARGFRGVFSGHFPKKVEEVETLAYHLAQIEANLPNTIEAIRLARYPGAGKRDPKRMALGLCENLSALHTHLSRSIKALEAMANGKRRPKSK